MGHPRAHIAPLRFARGRPPSRGVLVTPAPAALRLRAAPLKGGLGWPFLFLFSAREIDPLKAGSHYGDPLWGSPVGGGPKNLTPPLGVADRRGAKGKPTPTEEPAFCVGARCGHEGPFPPCPHARHRSPYIRGTALHSRGRLEGEMDRDGPSSGCTCWRGRPRPGPALPHGPTPPGRFRVPGTEARSWRVPLQESKRGGMGPAATLRPIPPSNGSALPGPEHGFMPARTFIGAPVC